MTKKITLNPTTPLERHVAKWLRDQGKGYDNGIAGAYKDLMHGRCSSGIVGHLIYYSDTVKFYKKHQKEIDGMIAEMVDTGKPIQNMFSRLGWEIDDPMARKQTNQNILAWFGFEEAACKLMRKFDDTRAGHPNDRRDNMTKKITNKEMMRLASNGKFVGGSYDENEERFKTFHVFETAYDALNFCENNNCVPRFIDGIGRIFEIKPYN